MGFNYAREKAKFDRQWAELRRESEQVGMSEDAIQKMYDFDLECFKSQRRYDSHQAGLPEEATVETIQQASTGTLPGDIPETFGADPSRWLDEIEDEQLLRKLVKLSSDDLSLLTCLVFEEYTQCEVAQQKAQNQQSISRQLQQIRKTLRKCV